MGKNIGFVSTRFAGTDGVSMESSKWADILEEGGHTCFWFAGEVDRESDRSLVVPEAHFQHEQNRWINERIIGRKNRKPSVTDMIHAIKDVIKVRLVEFVEKFSLDMLIVENALTIPMHVPLGIALTETIVERMIPCIAHHQRRHTACPGGKSIPQGLRSLTCFAPLPLAVE